jgi:hypothetical protein
MDITIEDVKAFVASRGPDESVGTPMRSGSCLTASTIAHKYPDVTEIFVPVGNHYATVTDADGNDEVEISLALEVREAARKFDWLRGSARVAISRQVLEEEMPELFEQPQ